MTATRPPVCSPAALIVVRPPKNQSASPSPGARRDRGARDRCIGCHVGVSLVEFGADRILDAGAVTAPSPARGDISCRVGARYSWGDGRPPASLDEIASLAARALPREQLFAELAPRLRQVIDSDATLLAHAGPVHAADDERRAGRARRTRHLHGGDGAAAGEMMVRSEYLIEDFNTFAEPRWASRSGQLARAGDARPARAQYPLSRAARSGRDPARAACGIRSARACLGRGAHRPPRVLRSVQRQRRKTLARVAGCDRARRSARRCDSTLRAAVTIRRRRGWCSRLRATRSSW